MSFIAHLRDDLIREYSVRDLSAELTHLPAPIVALAQPWGPRRAALLVPVNDVDRETAEAVVEEVFAWVRPRRRGERGPNNAIATVILVSEGDPVREPARPAVRISHAVVHSGIVLPWWVDVDEDRVETHDNPVSIWPPVWVTQGTPVPSLRFLQHSLASYRASRYARAPVQSALDVLFCDAPSTHRAELDVGPERTAIERALRGRLFRRTASVSYLRARSPGELVDLLQRARPRILHIAAHGTGRSLVFEGGAGGATYLDKKTLLEVAGAAPLTHLVLSACHSSVGLDDILAENPRPFHVVAMRDEVSDHGMERFAAGFYGGLAARQSTAAAVQAGLRTMGASGAPDASAPVHLVGTSR